MRLLLILLLLPCFSFGQNLVPNPSFEDTVACPDFTNQVDRAQGWSSYGGTPDYFHTCSQFMGIPNNYAGTQNVTTGDAYCLFAVGLDSNIRESIGRQLSDTLVIGEKYYASLKVSLSETFSNVGIDKIGFKFSTVPYSQTNWLSPDNVSHIYSNNIITDSLNWTVISGSFIADSSYGYVIIGNFFDDANIDTIKYSESTFGFDLAGYYVDDICVSTDSMTCDWPEVGIQEDITNHDILIFPNPTNGVFTVTGASGPVQVFDLLGNLLLTIPLREIDLSFYPSGVYVVKVGEQTQKLVLSK